MLCPRAGQKPLPVLVTPSCRLLRARRVHGGVVPGTATQVSRFLPNKNTELDTLPGPFLCQLPLLSAEFCCVPTCLGLIRNLRDGFSHCLHFSKQETEAQKSHQAGSESQSCYKVRGPPCHATSRSCLSDAPAVPQGESGDSAQRHGYCNKVYLLGFLFLHKYLLKIHFVTCVPHVPSSLCISFFIVAKYTHHFADKGPCNQSYGFSSRHVWM